MSFRSPVIAAPERFDLVGLGGELRPLELRARDAGGDWSAWIETANGDPAYFGVPTSFSCAPGGGGRPGPCTTSTSPGPRVSSAACSPARGRRSTRRSSRRRARSRRPPMRFRSARPSSHEAPGARLAAAASRGPDHLRHGQGRRRPPHRDRERLQRGRGAVGRARDLPLSPQRQRVERHRLQRTRRPLREHLRRPVRRAQQGGGRRSRAGLQRADQRRGRDRNAHQGADHPGVEAGADRLPRVEARRPRAQRPGQDDDDLRRRRRQPLRRRPPGADQEDHRSRFGGAHLLPGRGTGRRDRAIRREVQERIEAGGTVPVPPTEPPVPPTEPPVPPDEGGVVPK